MTTNATTANESGGFSHVATGQLDTTHGVVLYLEDISVSFDGFKALNRLSLQIDIGELRCVIGPNGAGKTTMMDVITGKTRPDEGTVFFGQTIDLTRMTEAQISTAGVGSRLAGDHVHHRGLACTVGTDHATQLAGVDRQGKPVERFEAIEADRDVFEVQDRPVREIDAFGRYAPDRGCRALA